MDRRLVHWKAEIGIDQNGRRFVLKGYIHDVSATGGTLFSDDAIPSNMPVTLLFKIPMGKSMADWKTVRVISNVASVAVENDHFRIDLHFHSFMDDGKQALDEALRKRMS